MTRSAAVAKRFPKTNFAIIDFPWVALKGKPKNVRGLIFTEQEAGYLAGVAAATVAKTAQPVSSVGGQAVPAVVAFLAGYKAGATKTKAGTKVLSGYSQDFVDQAKCKELALEPDPQGVGGRLRGRGRLRPRRPPGGEGAGRLGDRRRLRPGVPRHAHPDERDQEGRHRGLRATAGQVKDGKFKGGTDGVFTVKNGGVGFGKVSVEGAQRAR